MKHCLVFLVVLIAQAVAFLASAEDRVLRVGVHDKPPYATKENGEWTGLGVELWRRIGERTGMRFEFVEEPFDEILPKIASGELDAAVGEFDVTSQWEEMIDFSQPFLVTSLGVAVRDGASRMNWGAILRDVFNWSLVQVLLWIFAGMFVVSLAIWALEKHHHVGHFKGGLHGFGSALWFSAVTMTTVGYGDKTPSTFAGRFVAFCWMLIGLLLVAGFTGAVASSMAAARLDGVVTRSEDLRHLRCGAMEGSHSAEVLKSLGIPVALFDTVESALVELRAGRLDAVGADRLTLAYLIRTAPPSVGGNPPSLANFSLSSAAVAIPLQSALPETEMINVAVLKTMESPEWQAIKTRWLGSNAND